MNRYAYLRQRAKKLGAERITELVLASAVRRSVPHMSANGLGCTVSHGAVVPAALVSTEWYMPPKYIDAVHEVLGTIELDPASSPLANLTVRAVRIYTVVDDGLPREWRAKTAYLNPPYGLAAGTRKSNQAIWSAKLVAEYDAGRVAEAILAVNAHTSADWFKRLWHRFPICFAGKIAFRKLQPDGTLQAANTSTFGTAFVYLGPNEARFKEVFGKFGPINRAH
jgi:hypothetical protein